MTARPVSTLASLVAVLLTASACVKYHEISVETPIRARIDVSGFERVLVAGFIAGGTDDIDSNLETTRLLRSQLRTRADLRVIDTDVLPLMDVALRSNGNGFEIPVIREERDLEPFEHLFANVDYWKRIGEEYQEPLIVTGTILFSPQQTSRVVTRNEETFDELGRRVTSPVRQLVEQRGFVLQPRFVFIDGRSGTVIHRENFREEILYGLNNPTPALSSYFELMDRLLPSFLNALSSQTVRGTRVLLR